MSSLRFAALGLTVLAGVAAIGVEAQPPMGGDPNAASGGPASGNVITVRSSRFGSNVTLGGTVVPYKEVTLTAQLPGRVDFIAGREGDWFDQGKVLVAINDDELVAKRRQILAELANADSVLRNASVQYSRELWQPQSRDVNRMPGMGIPSMFDQMFTRQAGSAMGYGSPGVDRYTDLYSQGTAVSQAQSRVIQSRSMLEEVDAKLKDTKSVAPFGGVIVRKLAEVGDTVQPGQPLLAFADTKYLQIKVDVPARLMPGVQKGMIMPARLDVGNTRVDVRVAQVFPMADVQRHTVTVKLDMPTGTPGGPGMYAEVMVPDINAPAKSMPVVPSASLIWRGSLPAVFVVTPDNRTELRLVRVGGQVDSQTVSVLSGLQEGERILASPPSGMASGWSQGAAPNPSSAQPH